MVSTFLKVFDDPELSSASPYKAYENLLSFILSIENKSFAAIEPVSEILCAFVPDKSNLWFCPINEFNWAIESIVEFPLAGASFEKYGFQ